MQELTLQETMQVGGAAAKDYSRMETLAIATGVAMGTFLSLSAYSAYYGAAAATPFFSLATGGAVLSAGLVGAGFGVGIMIGIELYKHNYSQSDNTFATTV